MVAQHPQEDKIKKELTSLKLDPIVRSFPLPLHVSGFQWLREGWVVVKRS